jgi:chromosome segregation ATPase
MKKFGQVLTCVFVVFALVALVGCGVSKEDHEKVVSDLNKVKADLERSAAELKKANADLAQANTKAAALEKTLNKVNRESEEKVAAAQKQCGDVQAKVDSVTKENAELKGMLDKLKAQLADLQKKAGGAQVPGKSQPAVPAKKP